MTTKGYLIAEPNVTDPVAFENYKRLAECAVREHGGRYLVRGGELTSLEGDRLPPRVVIVEFPSLEEAKRFYDSAAYEAARAARAQAATMNMLVVAGIE